MRSKLLYLLVILAMLFSCLPAALSALAQDGEEEAIDLPPLERHEKGNPKLDTQLNQLVSAKTSEEALNRAQQYGLNLDEEYIRVIVECMPGQADDAIETAVALGAQVETGRDDQYQMYVPLAALQTLTESPDINFIRLPLYLETYVTSQGVALTNADDWHTAGYTGAGVKIAVLDIGFSGYLALLGNELPASVTTRSFLAGGNINGPSGSPQVHGTACAEIVHDMAPDAQLYLVNFGTNLEIFDAIDYLIYEAQVDVITLSAGNPLWAPGDGTGPIADKIAEARAHGIFWSQAMGNYGTRHWQGDFIDGDIDGNNDFRTSPRDELISVSVLQGQTLVVRLKWDDPWGASSNDYDLALYQGSTYIGSTTNEQNGNDLPIEGFSFGPATAGIYGIAIEKYSATQPVHFHLYSETHDIETALRHPEGSLTVPADSLAAISVGAVNRLTPTKIEPYSSRGPNDNGNIKPDLVAPDNVSSVTYPAFTGTSASTPHVAGAAALIMDAFPAYTPVQIQSYLESNAVPLGALGKDNVFGSGRLNLGIPPSRFLTMAINGSGSTAPAVGTHEYAEGSVVDINATAATHWGFVNWTGDTGTVADVNSASTNVTMNNNYSITANFFLTEGVLTMAVSGNGTVTPAIGDHTYDIGILVNISAVPDAGWRFVHWTGDVGTVTDANAAITNVTITGDYVITAVFDRPVLTMAVNGNGSVTPAVGPHTYNLGTVVPITATPATNWAFVNWTGEVWDVNSASTNVTMDADKTATANFTRTHGTLTMAVSGNGTVTPVIGDHTYAVGHLEDIIAVPDDGWRFVHWTGDVVTVANVNAASTNVTINGDYVITAVFDRPVLTMAVNGGGNVIPAVGPHTYDLDSVVPISANASVNWAFSNWTGEVLDANSASTNVTMDTDKTVTANFIRTHSTLLITVNGSGDTTGAGTYTVGYTANITATPLSGWRFVNWTGDVGTIANVNAASTNVTMNDDYNIFANFARIQQATGGGGGGGGGSSDSTSLSEFITGSGKFVVDATAQSADQLVKILIPKDTIGKDRNGGRLRFITIKKKSDAPEAPGDYKLVCLVYDIGPAGATLEPFAHLIFYYKDSQVPAGVAEENLLLATLVDGAWVMLEDCVVDPTKNTITAPIKHFSVYTAVARTVPASFEVAGLTVKPSSVKSGDPVTVDVTVTNSGDLTGSYTVALKINNVEEQTKAVTLKGSESQKVSFTVKADKAGTYAVDIGGLSDKFTVEKPKPEGTVAETPVPRPPEPSPTPTPPPAEEPVMPSQSEPTEQPAVPAEIPQEIIPPSQPIAWWLIVIYAACGVIIVGLGVYLFIRRRNA